MVAKGSKFTDMIKEKGDRFDDDDAAAAIAADEVMALVPVEGTAGKVIAYDENGEYVFDASDIRRSSLRLAQGLTEEVRNGEARVGQVLLNGHAPTDEALFAPTSIRAIRQLYDEANNLVCVSDDGLVGKGDPGGECAACPLAQWTNGTDRLGKPRRVPPPCKGGFRYEGIAILPDSDDPEVVSYTLLTKNKGNQDAAGDLNKVIHTKRRRWGTFAVGISGKEFTDANGRSYIIPKVRPVALTDDQQAVIQEAMV